MGQFYKCLKCNTLMQYEGEISENSERFKCPLCGVEIDIIWDED